MSTLKAEIPDALYKQIQALASKENLSLDELVTNALTAQVSKEYLEKRAKRGSWDKFMRILDKVPDVRPGECDRL